MSRALKPPVKVASQTTGIFTRGRPVTKLRKIEEAAELLNVSPRTVRGDGMSFVEAHAQPHWNRNDPANF